MKFVSETYYIKIIVIVCMIISSLTYILFNQITVLLVYQILLRVSLVIN